MTSKDLDDLFSKFSNIIDVVNKEIHNSQIDNEKLKNFTLKFEEGKCIEVCIKDPNGSGRIICFCVE